MTQNPAIQPEILFIDDALLVINKPSGLLSVPDGYNPSLLHLKTALEPLHGTIFIVHRLDRDTSGVMIITRTAAAHQELNRQFREREIQKTYHALICGCPPWVDFLADFPLRINADRRHRTRVDFDRGQPATTRLHLLQATSQAALLEAHPQTGYTHQIRAHLAYCGYPILADPLYTFQNQRPDPRWMDRLGLHAVQITFTHPVSGQSLTFSAPYPVDFQTAIDHLQTAQNAH